MTSSELTVRSSGELEAIKEQIRLIQNTEFVPKNLRGNPHAILACILYGRELGLTPMVSLREIDMIDGTPTSGAGIVAAKVRAKGHRLWREEHRDEDGTVTGVTAHGERTDGTRDSFTFTLAMANRAGLLGKQNWKTYPEAMLWARACTQLARFLFSDVFFGAVYTGEEIGREDTDEHGALLEPDVTSARNAHPVDGGEGGQSSGSESAMLASQQQHAKLGAIIHELEENETPLPTVTMVDEETGEVTAVAFESWEDYSRKHAGEVFGVESRADLTVRQMSALISHMVSLQVPFS